MSSSTIEKLVCQEFDEFYRTRSIKLSSVTLRALLREKNLYLLCATHDFPVTKILENLLEEYMAPSDANFFGQTFLESIASKAHQDITHSSGKPYIAYEAIALINLKRNVSTPNQREFDKTRAKALNRLGHDFLNNFGNPDGTIDWEKLLRYNSGKENVPWVSKIVPVISTEDQDDNSDGIDEIDSGEEVLDE